ncbi:hypothetical protein ACHWQZ_G004831 [Mnemiopsis leidyi]
MRCIQIRDEGYYDCSTGREYLMHLKHDFLHAESRLNRPALITAIENALKSGQSLPSDTASPKEVNELQRTVVLNWDFSHVEELLNRLKQHDHDNEETESAPEDPLLYLLARMIQHQRNIKTSITEIPYNSVNITSIVGRGLKLVLNNNHKMPADEPLVILHMGKERAMNIIPKKLNLAMLDVFDVQLGNFSIVSISNKTTDSMHISLPTEKSLEADDLDLHILVRLQCRGAPTSKTEQSHNGMPHKDDLSIANTRESEKKKRGSQDFHVEVDIEIGTEQNGTHDHVTTEDISDPTEHGYTELANDGTEHTSRDHEVSEIHDTNVEHVANQELGAEHNDAEKHETNVEKDGHKGLEVKDSDISKIMSSHSLDVPANQQVHNKAATEIRFVSKKLSVGVVNTYNKDTILQWLSQCGIAASSKNKVHKLRTKLLKYIQNIHEGKERPKISFVSSFLEKITYPQLRDEAKRLKIHIPKRALEPEARRIINHYFVTERNASPNPPLLISTDEELSSSETDSEDSWGEEPEKPQITKSKAVPIKRNTNNANSIDTKCKTLTKKNVLGKKVGNMSKNPNEDLLDRKACDTVRGKLTAVIPNPSATEIQIKSLEKTLLGFQSKIQHQETAIETIANRTNLNISPSEETSKKIKAIESKIKCLFENLNAQQNSVDNLSDCIKDGKKDKKRTQDKLSQIQALAKQQSEQNEEKSHELNSRLQSLIQPK